MDIHHKKLSNGLDVFVKKDSRSPVVLSQIWYKVGSSYEPTGLTGISHMLEHMMFKGTTTFPMGKIEEIVEQKGGEQNAFTGHDFTAYYQYWHKDNLELALQIESSRMSDLVFNDEYFQKERKVVMEERKLTTDDNPISFAYERFMATAYDSSPRRNPIIGWMHDIEQYELSDLECWYKKYYTPNNAKIVIVGDVEPSDVFELVEKHFNKIKANPIKAPKKSYEIPCAGHKHIDLYKSTIQVPTLILGYQTPSFYSCNDKKDVYSLMILDAILGDNDYSYLQKSLVREMKICTSIHSEYDPFIRYESMFAVMAIPQNGFSLTKIQEEIFDKISDIKINGIEDSMLNRIKNSIKADRVYMLDSIQSQGYIIGSLACLDMPTNYFEYLDNLKKVNSEDIKKVASKYLIKENLTTLHLQITKDN